MTRTQILQLLDDPSVRRLSTSHGTSWMFSAGHSDDSDDSDDDDDDDDDDEDEEQGRVLRGRSGSGRTRRKRGYPPIPSEAGKELMQSGTFGSHDRPDVSYRLDEKSLRRRKKLAYQTMMRELGLGSPGRQRSCNKFIAQVYTSSVNRFVP